MLIHAYIKGEGKDLLFVAIYVDDIIAASQSEHVITYFGQHLSSVFEIMDLGKVEYCLGMEFVQQKEEISICQSGYIRNVLDRFGMSDSKDIYSTRPRYQIEEGSRGT